MSASALAQFRNQIFDSLHLHNWADGIMDLIDTLSSAGQVRSVVELSLQPAFHGRHYSGLYKAVRYFPLSGSQLRAIFADYLPHPQERPFRLLAVDTVPHPRPFADCLQDRGYIYQPNPTPGGKPVAVGHTYSLLAFLPERESASSPPWVVFLDARRVATDQNAAQVAQEQVSQWLEVQDWYAPRMGGMGRGTLVAAGPVELCLFHRASPLVPTPRKTCGAAKGNAPDTPSQAGSRPQGGYKGLSQAASQPN